MNFEWYEWACTTKEIHKRLETSLPPSFWNVLSSALKNRRVYKGLPLVFGIQKDSYRGRPFGNNEEGKTAAKQFFHMQDMYFLQQGFLTLVDVMTNTSMSLLIM